MIFKVAKRVGVHSLQTLVLIILILAALYVSIGRILIGTVDNYTEELASLLEARLEAPVNVGKLVGRWSYLDPRLTVRNVTIGSPHEPAVVLSRISLKLNSVASLLEWNPVISELEVDGLRLSASQDEAGAWQVSGLASEPGGKFDAELFMDSLPWLNLVSLKDIEVRLVAQRSRYRVRTETGEPFELASADGIKTLSLPLIVHRTDSETGDSTAGRMQLIGRYRGDVRETGGFSTELYFQLPSLELTDFLPPLTFNEYLVSRIGVQGQFWFGYSEGAFTLTGMPVISDVQLKSDDRDLTIMEDLTSQFRMVGSGADDIDLQVKRLSAILGSREILIDDASIAMAGDGQVVARVPELDLGLIGNVATDLGHRLGLIDERGLRALENSDPKGVLQDVLLVTNTDGRKDSMRLTARVTDASLSAYRGSPAVSNLEGFVSIGAEEGYIDIHNDHTTLDFARMFDESWSFDSARGRINYSYRPGYFQVSSGLMEVVTGELRARGKFHLNLRRDRRRQTWGLAVGIENGQLLHAPRYMPNVMPKGVRQWLARSILGGNVRQAGLLFHGSLYRESPKREKVHQLYFKVDDAVLDYDPAWPPVEDLAATIYVHNDGVDSRGARGRIYESTLDNGVVYIPIDSEGKVDTINVDADLHGPLSDGIRLFKESALAEITGNVAADWTSTGEMTGELALNIPVGDRSGEGIGTDVSIALSKNDLYMPRYDLRVSNVDGIVDYSNENGLSSENLDARIFGKPASGSISSRVDGDAGEVIINLSGEVDVADLYDWSNQILLTRAEGLMPFDARVHVPYGARSHEQSYVEATSSLKGVEIDMPDPMAKDDSSEMPMLYRQYFLESGHQIDFDFRNRVKGSLKYVDDVVQGGRIRFGPGDLGAVTFDDLMVTGSLDYVDYDRWEELTEYLETRSEVSIANELAGRIDSINLKIGLLEAFEMELRDIRALISRAPDRWNVQLANELLAGAIGVPDNEQTPMNIDLDYLRLEAGEAEDEDPLSGVLAGELVPVDFSTRELTVGDENYGSWSFQFRPEDNGAILRNLTANVKGSRIVEPSEVYWETGENPQSRFKGTVVTDDLGSALEQWGIASSIKGKDFRFLADFQWPGSPAMISLESIIGRVSLRQGEGRFVQAESAGALNLLGIFDFQSLARRFRFDFSDIVDEGYSFRSIKGVTRFNEGVVNIVEPIIIEGASSTIKVGGTLDLNTGALDNEMIVTLPVNRNLPWYAAYSAIATGPLMGAGVILAQKIFESQIDQISSAKYEVTGTIDEPTVDFVSIFTDEMRELTLEDLERREVNPEASEESPEE